MRQSKVKRTNNKLNQNNKKQQIQPKPDEQSINEDWIGSKINIVLQNEAKLTAVPKILVNFQVYLLDKNVIASHLIQSLKKLNLVKEDHSLSYYLPSKGLYVFGMLVPKLGNPISKEEVIESRFLENNTIKIKIRERKKIAVDELIEEQKQKYEQVEDDKATKGQKQKKISEVVEKVALWRKFYTGFYDETGNYIQKQLDVAAEDVGIAKKTLDDYLLQIRNGKKYGFNFNEKFNNRIGELRAFVRDEKKKEK